ncbi:hypothetical protein [Streptomyces sp. NPDC058612]|uniref:hypothetical protein n=1 Tax=Streptomyces sp. NPDC058612 TaxID=3346555 RepID=UPI00364BB65A
MNAREAATPNTAPSMDDQAQVFAVLPTLRKLFGHLPAPYITISRHFQRGEPQLDLSVDSLPAWEEWRATLAVPAGEVTLHQSSHGAWLEASTVFCGVLVMVTVHLVRPAETGAL